MCVCVCPDVGVWQMLEENVRVALMIGESLRDQTIQMGLYEMENLLNKCVSECVCVCVFQYLYTLCQSSSVTYIIIPWNP